MPPGASVKCKAYAKQGQFEGGFDSTATVELEDGRSFEFKERGRVKTISYSDAWSRCEDSEGHEMIPIERRSVRRAVRGTLGM